MKLIIIHDTNENVEYIANKFDSNYHVEPYERIVAVNHDEVLAKFGYVFKAQKIFPNLQLEAITEILNDWFDNDDTNYFFSENEVLKQMSVTNPFGKYYKWHVDYESMKNTSGHYVESLLLENWDIKSQYREEYHQSLFYWMNHDTYGIKPDVVAKFDAMGVMSPHAIISHNQWIQGPPLDTFDMDLIGSSMPKMKTDMKVWVKQAMTIAHSHSESPRVTSIHYR